MSDRATLALAVAAAIGALVAAPVPVPLALAVVVAAFALRRPWLLVAGTALLTSALGWRATAGLAPPHPTPAVVERTVTLLADPVDAFGAVRVDVRVGTRRVEAWARGAPAAVLRSRLAGERVRVVGALRAPPEAARARLGRRHVSARLSVTDVEGWAPGDPASRLANRLRRTLVAGASSLAPEQRSLFTGLVLGDRRGQSPTMTDDFRASGLTHLLAVSGQNVAFVLALAGPVLRRLRQRGRWAAAVAVVAFFALLTRWEPSVLRASALAVIALTASTIGRSASPVRLLALAVSGLLVLDPFLVRTVAFLLSVGASLGIMVLAAPLLARLPGPRLVAEPLAVTLAAQIGVAPVLIPVFGGMPVASVPANLLAVPAAGPVMVWGLTGGLVAGLVEPPIGAALHRPTAVLVDWIAIVARWAASLPLGELRAAHAAALGGLALVAVAVRRWCGRAPVAAAPGTAVACLAVVLLAAGFPSAGALDGVGGCHGTSLWRGRAGGVVLVLDGADAACVLALLRRHDVRRVDVAVTVAGSPTAAGTVADLRARLPLRLVLAPVGHRVRQASVPVPARRWTVGGVAVVVRANRPTLEIDVLLGAADPGRARAPPG